VLEVVADGLSVRRDDGVITWMLDAPARRNAVSPDALAYIAAQCPTLNGEIVVLRGAGDEAFCAGFDLRALNDPPAPPTDRAGGDEALPDAVLFRATRAMRRCNATLVAAIGGYAIGAGVELACAADVRVAKRGAWFQIPAARLGVVYHAAGLASIRDVFGGAGATQLLMLGRRLDADSVLRAGGLLDVVAADDFEAALDSVVTDLRAAAPLSLAGNRTLLRALADVPLDAPTRAEHTAARVDAYASEDHREARAAIAERRPPRFAGR